MGIREMIVKRGSSSTSKVMDYLWNGTICHWFGTARFEIINVFKYLLDALLLNVISLKINVNEMIINIFVEILPSSSVAIFTSYATTFSRPLWKLCESYGGRFREVLRDICECVEPTTPFYRLSSPLRKRVYVNNSTHLKPKFKLRAVF